MDRKAINKARIVYYGFFSSVFSFNLTQESYPVIKNLIALLVENPVDDETAEALGNIKSFLDDGGYEAIKAESDMLFFSPIEAFLPMTASFYHEGRDDGSMRLEMLDYVYASNYRRNTEEFKENEDHMEFIFLFMQRLIIDDLEGNPESSSLSQKVFTNILNNIIDEFASNLIHHAKSRFYRYVAVILHSFVQIERLLLGVEAPLKPVPNSMPSPRLKAAKRPSGRIPERNPAGYGCI